MIVYSSPGTGKSTFCKNNPKWIDGDKKLADFIAKRFDMPRTNIDTDSDDFANFLLNLFRTDRKRIEECYTDYMNWIKEHKESDVKILIGTRRFMWLADKVFLEVDPSVMKSRNKESYIIKSETDSAKKWEVEYVELNGEYISLELINK